MMRPANLIVSTSSSPRPPHFEETQTLSAFAQVLYPKDAQQPILSIATQEAVHAWLVELNASSDFAALDTEARRTCMLAGPPGVGKTMLAHHIAARLGLPLVLVNMEDVIGMYLGETGRNLRAFMRECDRQAGLMVLFFDEFDALGAKRGGRMDTAGDHDRNAIATHMLQTIDRYKIGNGFLFAATNRVDIIDSAIHRRFSIRMGIGLPDSDARFAIMKRYLAPMEWEDEGFDFLVPRTHGASGALLKDLMHGIKREFILSRRLGFPFTPREVFRRIIATVQVHAEQEQPKLWDMARAGADEILDTMHWPPKCPPEIMARLIKTDEEIEQQQEPPKNGSKRRKK